MMLQKEDGEEAREWLNLSLGCGSPVLTSNMPSNKSGSKKVFSCNFCTRKFFSSQALGGHQNAHKRERGAARKYQIERMMTINYRDMVRSLGIRPHSFVHKVGTTMNDSIAKFNVVGVNSGYLPRWLPLGIHEGMDFMWPGSFRFNTTSLVVPPPPSRSPSPPPSPQQPQQQNFDLNLHL